MTISPCTGIFSVGVSSYLIHFYFCTLYLFINALREFSSYISHKFKQQRLVKRLICLAVQKLRLLQALTENYF